MTPAPFFKAVLEASWQGSLVILLLLLLRPLLGLWVPARWRSLLWMLVLLRLLVPAFLLPPSPTSLQNLAVVDRPIEEAGRAMQSVADPRAAPALWHSQGPEDDGTTSSGPEPVVPPQRAWWRIAAMVWFVGCALTGLWILVGTIILRRRLRRDSAAVEEDVRRMWERCRGRVLVPWSAAASVSATTPSPARAARHHGARPPAEPSESGVALTLPAALQGPALRQTDAVSSPALVGVLRPQLLIPRRGCETLSAEDWEHIFLHELAHFSRRDHWLQALQLVALCAHWFNPLVWLGFRFLRADRELAADEWALRHLGDDRRPAAYGDTLLKVLTAHPRGGLTPGLVGILEDGAQMKQRLRHIVAFRPRRAAGSIIGGALFASLAAILLTAAQGQILSLKGWSVVSVAIPKDGEIKDAYVELKSPAGRMVTLTKGVTSEEGVTLEKLDWSGSPIRVAVTLQKDQERAELTADPRLVSKNNELLRRTALIEIESKFLEVPDAVADALPFSEGAARLDILPGASAHLSRPRALSLRAVLDEKGAEQFLATLLAQKDVGGVRVPGVDMLSAPRVTSRSQQRAVIEIIREFRFPSEWNPPEQKDPRWTPKAFETRNVGVTLDVEPTLSEGEVIDLRVTPQVVEFLGFVDFETRKPLFTAKADPTKTALDRTFQSANGFEAPNRPFHPIFSSRSSRTEVTLHSGHTLVLIGSGETEDTKPFDPPSTGRQLVILIRASRMAPRQAEFPLPPAPPASPEAASDIPAAIPVEGKPGFVTSPHLPKAGYIDVRGFPVGTEVKCPYSGKMFRVPAPSAAGKSGSFSPAPFRLERSPEQATADIFRGTYGVRVPLPVGPVRIDYGLPIPAESSQSEGRRLDGPGPGYREQKSKALHQ